MGRKRAIGRHEAAVWCPSGRWGPRRTRTNECWSLIRAEDVYTALLKNGTRKPQPGSCGYATFTVGNQTHSAQWEVRSNAVWRLGRVFLNCQRCGKRCTRLYLPLETSWLACRRCWGLTYVSQALQNYKDSPWGRGMFAAMFGLTQRDWAYEHTAKRRAGRFEQSRQRWRARRGTCWGAVDPGSKGG